MVQQDPLSGGGTRGGGVWGNKTIGEYYSWYMVIVNTELYV